jgi:uncharacterized protein (DUF2147 family)
MKYAVMIIIFLLPLSVPAGTMKDDIVGIWWSPEQKTKVKIVEMDDKIYGKIIAVRPESKNKLDSKNPDSTLKDQKILGLDILKGFVFHNQVWTDGTIYDPENGKTYNCKMWLDGKNLSIRGYVGISLFGRTVTFTKVDGPSPETQQKGEPERVYIESSSSVSK